MKNLTTLLLLFPLLLQAKDYYVSTNGNDGNPGTEAAPLKTLSKINSLSLASGDRVLFASGSEFYGSLTAKAGVTYTFYGTGNKPIITGLTTINLWTSVGNGLYEAAIPSGLPTCNNVIMDGKYQAMGRYPKTGYIIATGGTTSSVTGPLSGLPSFVGGEIVWRPYHWVLWRGKVTGQTSTGATFTAFSATSGGSVYAPVSGFGFFFQNSPAACTSFGDWAYSGGKLTMFFGSAGPGGHVVQVSSIETIINVSGNSGKFDGIAIAGGNSFGVHTNKTSSGSINNCDVMYSGIYGINANSEASNWTITNSNITWSGSNAIGNAQGLQGWIITGNTISNTGSIAGMGGSGEGQYFAVINLKQGKFEGNTVRNTGYNGINFGSTNNSIKNNFIDSFCTVKDDGGAIYCGGQDNSGTVIEGNIALHGIGASAGTPDKDLRAHGVYIDDGARNIEIRNNTLAYNGGGGIYSHDSYSLNIHDNTCFDNGISSILYYNNGNTIAKISLNKNIFFAVKTSQFVHRSSGGTASPATFFTSADNNYWCRPSNENANFSCLVPSRSDNLSTWKTFTGKEASSKTTPAGGSAAVLIYNETDLARVIPAGYKDLFGVAAAINPHSSVIVIPGSTPPPQVFTNVTQSKAFTKNNCTSGTGSSVTYIVAAGKYSASTQAEADQLATTDVNNNGQNYANLNGTCTPKTIIKVVIYYSDGSTTTQQ